MDSLFEILKYVLPAVVVFATAYYLLKQLLENEERQRKMLRQVENTRITTPIRLQAYERIMLFLERISPESLLMRTIQQGMTCKQLQSEMLSQIRAEYEHNLSQQIYISAQAWHVVKSSKENMLKFINLTAQNLRPEVSAYDLSKAMLDSLMSIEKAPTATAIEYIKTEAAQLF